jgi:hypothetical protein
MNHCLTPNQTLSPESISVRAAPVLVRLGLLAIIGLGFVLRLHSLASESLWYDELLQLDIAQGPLTSIWSRLPRHAALPLDYLISHYWILLGRDEAWVRLPAVVVGTLTLPVAFQLGRLLLGRSAGLLLMTLLAVAPMHVSYSQEVRPYALMVLGVALAAYGFWGFLQTAARRYLPALQAGVLIFSLAHFFALAVYGTFILYLGIGWLAGRHWRRVAATLLALVATSLLPLLIYLALGWGQPLLRVGGGFVETAVFERARFSLDYAQKPNRGMGPHLDWSFIEFWVAAPLGAGPGRSVWVFNGLAGLGFVHLMARRRYQAGLFLGLWLVVSPTLILAFLLYRGTFFAPRYLIYLLPAYLALVALGLLALPSLFRRGGLPRLALAGFVISGACIFGDLGRELERLYRRQDKEDWRLVARFITANAAAGDAIIPVNTEPVVNWYYPPASAEVGHFTDLPTIRSNVSQAGRSWVILSRISSYIDDGVIKAWLGEMGAIRLDLDPEITVYYVGPHTPRQQLLAELREFALPVNHALYASLARENHSVPEIARRYYLLAIANAPDDELLFEYQRALEALPGP